MYFKQTILIVKSILLIAWIFSVGFFLFFGDINVLPTNPILQILFTFAVLPIVGIILMFIGAIFAYPLIYLFKLFN